LLAILFGCYGLLSAQQARSGDHPAEARVGRHPS
jgi:hypothetical protein